LAINIIRKDWLEHWKLVALWTAGSFVPVLIPIGSAGFRQGMLSGLLVASSHGYAYSCFVAERQRGTLQLLLGLPVRSFDLVVAKYASMYSMVLLTANVPGSFLGSSRALLFINAFALLFSTICMAASVVSDKPWAPVAPLWIVCIGFLPLTAFMERYNSNNFSLAQLVTPPVILLAEFVIVLAPMIALASALWFHRKALV